MFYNVIEEYCGIVQILIIDHDIFLASMFLCVVTSLRNFI